MYTGIGYNFRFLFNSQSHALQSPPMCKLGKRYPCDCIIAWIPSGRNEFAPLIYNAPGYRGPANRFGLDGRSRLVLTSFPLSNAIKRAGRDQSGPYLTVTFAPTSAIFSAIF